MSGFQQLHTGAELDAANRERPIYPHFSELPGLLSERLITRRQHPALPLFIYNYSASAQHMPIAQWGEAIRDCRGLILDEHGRIVARPFRKFWNYEQVLDQIPTDETFSVWEKIDGSLGIVCWYGADLIVATRGSFDSDQARWARDHLKDAAAIQRGLTYLFEIVYPENRIVVDYGDRRDMPLLAVLDADGRDHPAFDEWTASKSRRFDGLNELSSLSALAYPGEEGFVVRWQSGFRAKIKFEEYKRLHRLITQVSTRTIWELLRSGKDTTELVSKVPQDFESWVRNQITDLSQEWRFLIEWAESTMKDAPLDCSRKEFAEWAKRQEHPNLLFALLDKKPITDTCWKLVEPKWATPFRSAEAIEG